MEDKMVCFPEDEITKPREIIMDIMQHVIDRGLTDYSGGNMALRVGQRIYSTQTHSADKYRWKLRPDNIIVTDINKNILEGRVEKLSRELDLHIGILQRFPEINCTLHGNTFYSPLLVAAGVNPAGSTEVSDYYKINQIPVVPEGVEPLSDEENNIIFSYMAELKKKGEALVVIMPVHGIIVAAPNHDEAFALLEAVENNSKFVLFRELLKTSVVVSKVFSRLGEQPAQSAAVPAGQPIVKNPASDVKTMQLQQSQTLVSGSQPEAVQILDASVKILTAEDIIDIAKNAPVKILRINHPCKVTDFAETKAAELGIKIESNG
ncbi:MAG TPA: class II aldolase/adducin family protein [Candidatus Humimicrobiaceae bacterium]